MREHRTLEAVAVVVALQAEQVVMEEMVLLQIQAEAEAEVALLEETDLMQVQEIFQDQAEMDLMQHLILE
jgi:hypothetical protein